MNSVNLGAIDLNLLRIVDAVLQERSATRAAARLHLTQSAVSNALRRARAIFGDPLVVRTGRGFATTPRAEAIAPRLRAIFDEVQGVLAGGPRFDAATSARRFTIAATDAIGIILLPALLAAFDAHMPRASLRVVPITHVIAAGGLEHAGVDLLIGAPPRIPASCASDPLFDDPMVAIVRADHPDVGPRLSLAAFARLPHAELALFGDPDDRVDRALAARGLRRRVQVTTPHIAGLPFLIAGSDRVATVTRAIARAVAEPLGLRALSPPVELAPIRIHQIWHARSGEDPGHQALRGLVRDVVHRLRGALGVREVR